MSEVVGLLCNASVNVPGADLIPLCGLPGLRSSGLQLKVKAQEVVDPLI